MSENFRFIRMVIVAGALVCLGAGMLTASELPPGPIVPPRATTTLTSDLNFELSTDMIYVSTTVDGDIYHDTAVIELRIWWDENTIPAGTDFIDNMEMELCYDPTKLEFLESESEVPSSAWSGTHYFSYPSVTCSQGGNIRLVMENGTSSDDPTTVYDDALYATLKFTALCQSAGNINELLLVDGDCFQQIRTTDPSNPEHKYESTDLTGGSVSIQNYPVFFDLSNHYTGCALHGETFDVSVTGSAGFRSTSLHHQILFADSKLSFNDYTITNSDWVEDQPMQVDGNVVDIYLKASGDYVDEFSDAELYTLSFTGRDDVVWDGPDNFGNYYFVPGTTELTVYYDNATCPDITPLFTTSGGAAWMDEISDTVEIVNTGTGLDNMIEDAQDLATLQVRLKHNNDLDASGSGIKLNIDFGSDLSTVDMLDDGSDGVVFDYVEDVDVNGNDFLLTSSTNSAVLTCTIDDPAYAGEDGFRPLYTFRAGLKPGVTLDPQSWEERKIPVTVGAVFDDGSQQISTIVTDAETGEVYDQSNGLVFVDSWVQVPTAEFVTTDTSTTYGFIHNYLKVRNNFALDDFSVTVSVEPEMAIDCIEPMSGFDATDNGDDTWTIAPVSAGWTLAANEDYLTPVAKIWYEGGDCANTPQPSSPVHVTVNSIVGTGSTTMHGVVNEGTVSLDCNGYVQYQSPCGDTPIQKALDDAQAGLPLTYALSQNHPNPFNPTTVIEYAVPEQTRVVIEVYNMLGQRVTELVNEEQAPGRYNVEWDASRLASGIYLYRMEAGNFVETRKMMLMK